MGDLILFSDVQKGDRVKLPDTPWMTVYDIRFGQGNLITLLGYMSTGMPYMLNGYDHNHVRRIKPSITQPILSNSAQPLILPSMRNKH